MAHAEPRPREEIDAWKKRDPVDLFRNKLLDKGVLTQADVERIDAEVMAEMEEADRFAMESPIPDPSILDEVLYVDPKGGAL
jgi:pyruvate dehydrogenase E1 component alpha subunit